MVAPTRLGSAGTRGATLAMLLRHSLTSVAEDPCVGLQSTYPVRPVSRLAVAVNPRHLTVVLGPGVFPGTVNRLTLTHRLL